MKKLITITTLLLISIYGILGQSIGSDPNMPSYVGQSQDAYSQGRLGSVPVNESTGTINYSVPIYSYNCGDITVPISIKYSGNGVKVDQYANRTGINWYLSAGGVITRQVRDKPDPSYPKKFYTLYYLQNLPGAGNPLTGAWAETISEIASGQYDREADIFNYNFLGYRGSFFLDENNEVRLVKYNTEIKIEPDIDNGVNKNAFIITTTDGVKYFFGGENYSEITRTKVGANTGESLPAQTAFYLYKIISPKGNIINFSYNTYQNSYISGKHQTITMESGIDCSLTLIREYDDNFQTIETMFDNGSLYINEITSNNNSGKVVFHTPSFKLDSIEIFDDLNDKFITYNLNYYTPEGSNNENKRFFLTDIIQKNQFGKLTGINYSFSYDNPESLPPLFSYSQDHYGYFNGKNNSYLIPEGFNSYIDDRYDLADRDADFQYAKIGSLSKITLPTGGFTSFEYNNDFSGFNNVGRTFFMGLPNNGPDSLYCIYPSDTSTILIKKQHFIQIHMETEGEYGDICSAKLKVKDLTANDSVYFITPIGAPVGHGEPDHINDFDYLAKSNHEYIFELQLLINPETQLNRINADVWITYTDYNATPKQTPGFKIKRIIKQPDSDTTKREIIRYYYNTFENRDTTYRYITDEPRYLRSQNKKVCCGDAIAQLNVLTLTSNSLTSIYIDDSEKSLYPHVTISYGGDNFELGGIEKHFSVTPNYSPYNYTGDDIFSTNTGNQSWKNGTLLKEIIYKNENDSIVKVSETEYKYITDISKSYTVTNNIAQLNSLEEGCPSSGVSNVAIGLYYTTSNWHALDSVSQKLYLENDTLQNYVKYYYDSGIAGIPSRIKSVDSKGYIKEIKNYYPSDSAYFSGLTGEQKASLNLLFDQNRKGELIQSESYQNNEKLMTTRIIFKDWGQNFNSTGNLVLPEKIQTSTIQFENDSLEDRVFYNQYGPFGNLTEASVDKGIHTVYIWGYNGSKIVAKIQNAELEDIPTDLLSNIKNWNYTTSETMINNDNSTLRSVPILKNSIITTYTYEPITGLKSVTDKDGRTIKYFYDDSGRLKMVKDHNDNVIKKYEYNYRENN